MIPTKPIVTPRDAIKPVRDGHTIMIGGFGGAGLPIHLLEALVQSKASNFKIISNNADFGALAENSQIAELWTSYPVGPTSAPVIEAIKSRKITLHLLPQGTLVECIRAGGAGLGGILTPTGIGGQIPTDYSKVRGPDGKDYLIAWAIRADVALIAGSVADRYGNVWCRGTSLNYNLAMASAARYTVVEVNKIVEPGEIHAEDIHIPSAFIHAICVGGRDD